MFNCIEYLICHATNRKHRSNHQERLIKKPQKVGKLVFSKFISAVKNESNVITKGSSSFTRVCSVECEGHWTKQHKKQKLQQRHSI